MKVHHILRRAAAGVALACAAALPVRAADLPDEQRQGAVVFRSGGIGEDEAKAMQEAARQYPLALEFVAGSGEHRGAWLSDVDVAIRDGRGNAVLQTRTNGPFLLLRLPPGRYVVTAKNEDTQRSRRIDVPAHGTKRVVFAW